jgi:hypothetical protein
MTIQLSQYENNSCAMSKKTRKRIIPSKLARDRQDKTGNDSNKNIAQKRSAPSGLAPFTLNSVQGPHTEEEMLRLLGGDGC